MAQNVRIQVTPRTIWTVGLQVIGVAILWRSVSRVGAVLGLIALALLFAMAAEPAIRRMGRAGIARPWAVAILMTAGVALLGLLVGTLVPLLISQLRALLTSLPGLLQKLLDTAWFQRLETEYGVESQLRDELTHRTAALVTPLVGALQGAVGLVFAGVAVFFLVLFMLLFGPALYREALEWLGERRRQQVERVTEKVLLAVSGFIVGSLLVSAVGSVAFGTALALLGVPYFLPLGLSYLVLGQIPWIGSALTAVMVSLTTLAALGWRRALVVLVFFLVYQQLEGHILQPLVQRRTLKLSPLLISLVLLLGGAIAGLLGVILALPVTATAQVLLRELRKRGTAPPGEGGGEGLLFTGPVTEVAAEGPAEEDPVVDDPEGGASARRT